MPTASDLGDTSPPAGICAATLGCRAVSINCAAQRISQHQIIDNLWTPSFYGYDGGGNVRVLTNAAGAVTDSYEYDAWGNTVSTAGNRSGATKSNGRTLTWNYDGIYRLTNQTIFSLRHRATLCPSGNVSSTIRRFSATERRIRTLAVFISPPFQCGGCMSRVGNTGRLRFCERRTNTIQNLDP